MTEHKITFTRMQLEFIKAEIERDGGKLFFNVLRPSDVDLDWKPLEVSKHSEAK